MSATRTFPAEPESVPALRSFIRAQCGLLPAPVLADLALVASELATNAIQYARTAFRVHLDMQPSQVVFEISDAGSGVPRMGPEPSAQQAHGRGLRIVDALADEWGVRASGTGPGKTVWVRLSSWVR